MNFLTLQSLCKVQVSVVKDHKIKIGGAFLINPFDWKDDVRIYKVTCIDKLTI
jgi:hypothetical protein